MLDAEAVADIVSHMNADHSDAVALYLKAFTDIDSDAADNIRMTDIHAEAITICFTLNGSDEHIDISFTETVGTKLSGPGDARALLVKMVKLARERCA